ncbi:MAG: YlxR family protein [Clostridia bacterium]|nr:YlxR family protein [Clostridia bacterium]
MKKIPMRMCVACRQMQPKKTLVRIVNTTEDGVIIDHTGKRNGRGAYLCHNVECLNRAIKTKALDRALEKPVPVSLFDELREEFSNESEAR